MEECEFLNKISFFIQYNLPQLQYYYSNDTANFLYHPCNDFMEAKYYSTTEIASSLNERIVSNFWSRSSR